jgi:hypothetical protein
MKRYEEMSYEEKEIFDDGANYARAYINWCYQNFPYKMNMAGIGYFLDDLASFTNGAAAIRNIEDLTFKDFVKKYRHRL